MRQADTLLAFNGHPPSDQLWRFTEDYHPVTLQHTKRKDLERVETLFYDASVRYLTEYIEHSIAVLSNVSFAEAPPNEAVEAAIRNWLSGMGLFEDALSATFQQEMQVAIAEGLDLGIKAGSQELGLGILLQTGSPQAQAYARANSAKLVTGLLETTKRRMGDVIRNGIHDGNDRNEIAGALKEVQSSLPDWRAKLISQTETIRALTGGQLMEYKEAGVEQKEWLDGQPGACPTCHGLDGQTKPLDEDFHSSFGPIEGSPAHPGCRCGIAAKIPVPEMIPVPNIPVEVGKELSGDEAEQAFINALDAANNADSVIKSGHLEPYADLAPKDLVVWHTGDQPHSYWYVAGSQEGAQQAGRGKMYQLRVKPGARIYPDPETILGARGGMGPMYSGMASLKRANAAIIRRSDLEIIK